MEKQELKCQMLNPFGPMILSVEMSESHTDGLIKLSNNNDNRKNMDNRLVGQIKSEPTLTHKELEDTGFREIFCDIGKSYVAQRSCEYNQKLHNINTSLQSAWIVSQKENEYNPVHHHTHCQISAVMYLIVPEFNKPRGYKGKNDVDGSIEFINSTVDGSLLQAGQFLVKPKAGMLLMFPSNLLHTVYPFQGSEERRCIAFNLNFNLEKK